MSPPLLLITVLLAVIRTNAVSIPMLGSVWNGTEWIWPTSIVVGNFLYINGGEFYNRPNQDDPAVDLHWAEGTVCVDLSESWNNATLVYEWSIPPLELTVARPNMWYQPNDNRVYMWGGWPYNYSYSSNLWSFTPWSNRSVKWEIAPSPAINGLGEGATAPFGGAFVASNTTFYSLGGANASNAFGSAPEQEDENLAVQGLVEYDFASGSWSNDSTTDVTQTGYTTQAGAALAPNFGEAGFLVFIGGDIPNTQTLIFEGSVQLASMSVITLYDLESKTWYHQTATGDIPPERVEFCSVGAVSRENSFEIFIYGGSTNTTYDWANPDDEGFLNVYALSLPAFKWFKSNDSTPVRRSGHYCQIIGKRQMLSIGGRQPSDHEAPGVALDPWVNGLGVFDMTAFIWSTYYNADDDLYEQPEPIRQYYSSGYQTPTWSDPALATSFAFTPPATSNTSTSPSPGPTPATSAPSHKGHRGAIVGGVVGGVGGLVLLVILVLLILRRRLQRPAKTLRELEAPRQVPHDVGLSKPPQELASPTPELPSPTPELPSLRPELASPTPELPGQNISEKQLGIRKKPVPSAKMTSETSGTFSNPRL